MLAIDVRQSWCPGARGSKHLTMQLRRWGSQLAGRGSAGLQGVRLSWRCKGETGAGGGNPEEACSQSRGLNLCTGMERRVWLPLGSCPVENEHESHSVVSDSLWPRGLYSPWNSLGQNTGAGSLSLLQGIFPTHKLNQGLPHCRQILYQLSHKGSPVEHLRWNGGKMQRPR